MGQVCLFTPKTLFLRDSWVQIPPPALIFILPYLLHTLIKLFVIAKVRRTKMFVTVSAMPTRNRVADNTLV
jgi:hypothetical protein